ncbi:sugar kinase [Denitrobaculum tricleocarpae]|uniref:2-dehydro-3-deoxygluconokinase n=1 Tax=Denitrobaculum tricleocarpae TaxID=2591009 RepID=A0A545T415_9PROT|nr:sugar kinase [Denitrobaculum tricleocarpae]TQV71960.1 sugar kinase [Denitrobaculum tricleocarpae]
MENASLKRVAAIGECMVELRDLGDGTLSRGFGGDTLNTAVYMARRLEDTAAVEYVTALGDDPFSEEMMDAWRHEGVGISHVVRLPGRRPGLYVIKTDETGERSFFYWRGEAAARDILSDPACRSALDTIVDYDLIYLSGITLGILDNESRAELLVLLDRVKAKGGLIAFDGNFRPALWPSFEIARAEMEKLLQRCDIALPSFDDEASLFGDKSPQDTVARLQALGVGEAVVKNGAEDCLVLADGTVSVVTPQKASNVVDTTAAGDSFNGAYLAARLLGQSAVEAAEAGHRLAAYVVTKRGAIVD